MDNERELCVADAIKEIEDIKRHLEILQTIKDEIKTGEHDNAVAKAIYYMTQRIKEIENQKIVSDAHDEKIRASAIDECIEMINEEYGCVNADYYEISDDLKRLKHHIK